MKQILCVISNTVNYLASYGDVLLHHTTPNLLALPMYLLLRCRDGHEPNYEPHSSWTELVCAITRSKHFTDFPEPTMGFFFLWWFIQFVRMGCGSNMLLPKATSRNPLNPSHWQTSELRTHLSVLWVHLHEPRLPWGRKVLLNWQAISAMSFSLPTETLGSCMHLINLNLFANWGIFELVLGSSWTTDLFFMS